MSENISLNFLLFCIPPEIWENHISIFLDKKDLCNLRLTSSYFRKEVIHSYPLWKQWVPYHELKTTEDVYFKLKWTGKKFAMIFGIYIDKVYIPTENEMFTRSSFLDSTTNRMNLPDSLWCLDISQDPSDLYDIQLKSVIPLLPSSLKYICLPEFYNAGRTSVSEDTMYQIYTHSPQIIICFKYMEDFTPFIISALFYACVHDYISIAKYLFKEQKKETCEDIHRPLLFPVGCHPIHITVRKSNLELTRLLLENGADPNIRSEEGLTPLMMACEKADIEVIKLLLRHGADKNIKYNGICTAKDFITSTASDDKIQEITQLLS